MSDLRYTLLADGSSDRVLIPILTWLLREQGVLHAIQPEWADLTRLRRPPSGLERRIEAALALYPCDLLFVHRDAEREPYDLRRDEILRAVAGVAGHAQIVPPVVCVVPVRMQEAWLLFDVAAIRIAAGNANGRQPLQLPRLAELENLPDPKETLFELVRQASGLNAHRLKRLRVNNRRITELIDDFGPLRALRAFAALEQEVELAVREYGWRSDLDRGMQQPE